MGYPIHQCWSIRPEPLTNGDVGGWFGTGLVLSQRPEKVENCIMYLEIDAVNWLQVGWGGKVLVTSLQKSQGYVAIKKQSGH